MGEVIDGNDLGPHIRYRHRIDAATWSSKTNLWTIEATNRNVGSGQRPTGREATRRITRRSGFRRSPLSLSSRGSGLRISSVIVATTTADFAARSLQVCYPDRSLPDEACNRPLQGTAQGLLIFRPFLRQEGLLGRTIKRLPFTRAGQSRTTRAGQCRVRAKRRAPHRVQKPFRPGMACQWPAR
jgi:hypothetical protein